MADTVEMAWESARKKNAIETENFMSRWKCKNGKGIGGLPADGECDESDLP